MQHSHDLFKNSYMLSLDYELFFGSQTGTNEKSLFEPISHLLDEVSEAGCRLVLFVDAGYLEALQREGVSYPQLLQQYDQISEHLISLSSAGHDIQLHIHPHWEDTHYNGNAWSVDVNRYRLHAFNPRQRLDIVARYKAQLQRVAKNNIFAYRAGGWCMQPFSEISDALIQNGVWLDSTVYYGGYSDDPLRWFDYRETPVNPYWSFSDDPNKIDTSGKFIELPISSQMLSPLFFWKLAFSKKFKRAENKPFGDGNVMQANSGYYLSKLFTKTYSPVSIDGLKSGQVPSAYKKHQMRRDDAVFNIMGHPKSLTPYSVRAFGNFLRSNEHLVCRVLSDFEELKPF
ncbi:hypothetical protein NBRC116494_16650 [Aurantivibrio plasticivorans]